ncbi:MAG: metal ABC transporter ATP-binding protein [Syntrophomonadaceae bacterium]|jgi:zinc transport system ATP-binding protein|nr:metal ABC transporter ATP-binding protein [Syntrophomonadaceae bacterium]
MNTVVQLEDVDVYYGNLQALSNITLNIEALDFLGIIGPNGGGKSTLLKLIAGLVKPSSGKAWVLGSPPCHTPGKIGYVPQRFNLNREFPFSVVETILTGRLTKNNLFLHRYTDKDILAVDEIMRTLGIYDLKDRQIGQLSGGQMQRALIARALVMEPEILLLDEPTACLDAGSKSQIYSILKDLNQYMTIIMVSHDMGVISSYVKSLACLNMDIFYHGVPELTDTLLGQVYGCPVELIAHGVPHRVLPHHPEEPNA